MADYSSQSDAFEHRIGEIGSRAARAQFQKALSVVCDAGGPSSPSIAPLCIYLKSPWPVQPKVGLLTDINNRNIFGNDYGVLRYGFCSGEFLDLHLSPAATWRHEARNAS